MPRARTILFVLLAVLAVLWLVPTILALFDDLDVDIAEFDHLPLVTFGFVAFDAVIPIFPSESLLTAASNLAAQPDSTIELWTIIVAGSLGAIVGDSLLYWLSRTALRRVMSDRLERAEQDPRVSQALAVFDNAAPPLIVFGRFVPGIRFVVGATMGLSKYPYRRFLMWDAIGGTLWATFTCVFSYAVASVIEDMPVLSIAVSVLVTTALLALLYKPLKSALEESRRDEHLAES